MGMGILVLGESGTGKSTALRNFKKDEVAIINVAGKPLPFKDPGFGKLSGTVDFRKIKDFIMKTPAKNIVIDDAQYIMSFQYMRRIKENGWDKFNELQSDFFNLIDLVPQLPDDKVVFFLSHLQTMEDGRQKIKTIGKMLDEKITIEGMFSVVLKTYAADGKYYFLTQNSGNDTVKSPMDMFGSFAIDNDLKYVSEKVRNYYELGEFLSNEDLAAIDEAAEHVDFTPDDAAGKKKRRGKENAESANTGNTDAESEITNTRRRRGNVEDTGTENNTTDSKESESESNDTAGKRRRRTVTENMADARKEVKEENDKKIADAGLNEAGDKDEVPFEEVKEPELTPEPRRKRRGANTDEPNTDEPMNEPEENVKGDVAQRRRRRRC